MSKIVDIDSRRSDSYRFESMMKPHFPFLYNSARRLTASSDDAEDLVQEVCVKAYLRLADLEAMDYQRAWLLRILYNLFIDDQRRQRRSPVSLAGSSEPIDITQFSGPDNLQPEKEAERELIVRSILNAMSLLSKEQCSLLVLHDIDGFSVAELQTLTGLPAGTIKSKLHRARIKLGKLLQREAPAEALMTQAGV